MRIMICVVVLLAAASSAFAQSAAQTILTGPARSTYVELGRDLVRLVAAPAGLGFSAVSSRGSADNVKQLRTDPAARMAFVQSDVLSGFRDAALAGNSEAGELVDSLRVVIPLFEEEIYFVVRADSPLTHIHQIKDKRINIGPLGSGTALTATVVYRAMFGSNMNEKNATFFSNEEALRGLAVDRSIDVAVVVAAQPSRLFSEMTSEARRYIKILALDPAAPEMRGTTDAYHPRSVLASSYPTWLENDVLTLATRTLLITYDFQLQPARESMVKFAESLCGNFTRLVSEGHQKWSEVRLDLAPVGNGWTYYSPTKNALSACIKRHIKKSEHAPRSKFATCEQHEDGRRRTCGLVAPIHGSVARRTSTLPPHDRVSDALSSASELP